MVLAFESKECWTDYSPITQIERLVTPCTIDAVPDIVLDPDSRAVFMPPVTPHSSWSRNGGTNPSFPARLTGTPSEACDNAAWGEHAFEEVEWNAATGEWDTKSGGRDGTAAVPLNNRFPVPAGNVVMMMQTDDGYVFLHAEEEKRLFRITAVAGVDNIEKQYTAVLVNKTLPDFGGWEDQGVTTYTLRALADEYVDDGSLDDPMTPRTRSVYDVGMLVEARAELFTAADVCYIEWWITSPFGGPILAMITNSTETVNEYTIYDWEEVTFEESLQEFQTFSGGLVGDALTGYQARELNNRYMEPDGVIVELFFRNSGFWFVLPEDPRYTAKITALGSSASKYKAIQVNPDGSSITGGLLWDAGVGNHPQVNLIAGPPPDIDDLIVVRRGVDSAGATYWWFSSAGPNLFPVTLVKTSGNAGSKTTQCSFVYTVTSLGGLQLGTAMSPGIQRPLLGAMVSGDGKVGSGYFNGATFVLYDANECMDTGACA